MTISSTRSLPSLGLACLVALGVSAAVGCGDSGGGTGGTSSTTTVTTATTTTSGATTSASTSTGAGGGNETGPIVAPDNAWTYVPFSGAVCMNGTSTGIGINKTSASKNLVIFMQGGNACFNAASCSVTAHKNGYGPADFDTEKAQLDSTPFFDRTSAANPLKDYNYVYIPYCTGDLHFGDNDTMVGGKARTFHGYNNVLLYLQRIVATYPDATNVILSGVSAGGFGSALNYDQVSKAFPTLHVTLIDDSGPPMIEPAVAVCLQKHFYDTWGFAKSMPAGCAGCKPANGAFLKPFVDYITSTYTSSRLGLISSTQDGTISQFLSFGDNNCSNIDGLPIVAMDAGAKYTAGLQDLRDNVLAGKTNFKMFLIDGVNNLDNTMQSPTEHVWLDNDPATVISHSTTLQTWLNQLISGDAAWANVP